MVRSHHIGVAVILAAMLTALAACGGGGGGSAPPPPTIVVTVTAPSATLKLGESQTYTATVTGTGNTAVTWSAGGAGCSGAACGSITSGGVYTAPQIVPQPAVVLITATLQADTSRTGSAGLTIGSDVAVSVWPPTARVTVGSSRPFIRMLTGSSEQGATWTVSGTGCTGAQCGSVGSDGVYVAPAQVPAGDASVQVRATAVADVSRSAQATVTLQASDAASLNHAYAYLWRGYSAGHPAHLVGRVALDGAGGVSAGVLDGTWTAGAHSLDYPLSGTYSLGADGRGTLATSPVAFSIAVPTAGEHFYMQGFYVGPLRGTGVALRQDPAAFSAATLSGNYVFLFDGWSAAETPLASVGRFTADGNGNLSAGTLDTNDGTSGVIDSRSFTGTYTVSTSGRGTATFVIPGLGSRNYLLHVVSADRVIISSVDLVSATLPLQAGIAYRQSVGPFSAASLAGSYVLDLTARNSAASAVATVGRLTSLGTGTIDGLYDRNDNYAMSPLGAQPISASYTLAANGRGLLDATTLVRAVFYMVSPDKALLLEAPGSNPARVQTGMLQRQAVMPYAAADLVGRFAAMTMPPLLVNSVTMTGTTAYTAGAVTSAIDIASPCALTPAAGSSAQWTVSSSGHIDVRASGVQHAAGWLIDPVRYVMVLQRPSAGAACDEVVHNVTAAQ